MKCDYICQQNNGGKCTTPGHRECPKAKDDMYAHTNIEGNVYYVFGKKMAKKAKEQYPSLTVMYRNARTKGTWVEYKEDDSIES